MLTLALLPAAPVHAWEPDPPAYGVHTERSVPVTMSDGTVLRANVLHPTDPETGELAPGPFPVVMVQTPYGKDTTGAASGSEGDREAGTQAGPIPFFVKRGYINVVAEVRGTGDSHGEFDLLHPIQGRDGAELVQWAAKLPHSNGKVGLYGPSYMGLDQYMTAAALGPKSPLRALFPIAAGNDTYRDAAFMGGMPNAEFDLAVVLTIFGPLHIVNPFAENPTDIADLLAVVAEHVPALYNYNASQILNILTGGDQAYDGEYWKARAPRYMLSKIVRNRLPVYMVGGWFDVYQRGMLLNYSGLQNLERDRPVGAPMRRRQRASSRYQLLQGPWYHLALGTGVGIYRIEMAWFDRWLKGRRTGILKTRRPLHVSSFEGTRWVDAVRYPFSEARARTYYLGGRGDSGAPSQNDGSLSRERPRADGADQVSFVGAQSPCSISTDQWALGATNLATEAAALPPNPCSQDDRTMQTGPDALTYTTEPFERDTVLAGPIAARVYATSTKPNVELVAFLEDVAPDGRSTPFSSGALLGSHRAIDRSLSWRSRNGRPLLPYHPYTLQSVKPVPVGAVTRFDVEIYPSFAQLRPGHRLRLTLRTSDLPHLLPLPQDADELAGGVYQIQRNSRHASYVNVPMAPAAAFARCSGQEDIYRYKGEVEPARVSCLRRDG